MTNPVPGTVEYYKNHFADIIGELGDIGNSTEEHGHRILLGFRQAIEEWLEYHDEAARAYTELRTEFLDSAYASIPDD